MEIFCKNINCLVPKKGYTNFIFSFLFFLLLPSFAYSQLANFTLNVTPMPETCSGNGTLSWTTSNTTPGSTLLFSIYHLPDVTTPIAVQATNSLIGLTAGTYLVIATQSLGSSTNTEEETVTIIDEVVDLVFNLVGTDPICGMDGEIDVNITQGNPVLYEIFSGPVLIAPQSSNIFTGLTAGVYQIRVFDNCGEGVVQTYTLFGTNVDLAIYVHNPAAGDCETLVVELSLSAGNNSIIAFPLVVQCVVTTPTGGQLFFNQTITSGIGNFVIYSESIPYFEGEIYSYTISITDNCGNAYTLNNTINNFQTDPSISFFNSSCSESDLYIYNVIGVIMLTAPPAYQGTLPENLTPQINGHTLIISDLPLGIYTFLATGLCGQEVSLIVEIIPPAITFPTVNIKEGCEAGMGSFFLNGEFVTVILNEAPAAFSTQLPMDLTANLNSDGTLTMNSLPAGEYILHVLDPCGNEFDVVATIQGYQSSTTVNVMENCNSFDLELIHISNNLGTSFWLQKYNPIANLWEHPATGDDYIEGTIPTPDSSIQILNNSTTYNLGYTGIFRIIAVFNTFDFGPSAIFCLPVIYEFEYNPGPEIINVYSLACTNNTYDLIVDAVGLPPLIYRITSKNGVPFLVNNGTTSIFLGLEPAIYNIQVEDNCGNILNRLFDIPTPFPLTISGTGLCDGQNGGLSTPYFSFLDYTWWKGNDTSNVLSTTGSLLFSPFNAATDGGIYHVRITYNNPGSCIDIILDFDVTPGTSNPEAGTGTLISYCNYPNVVDLYSLLTPPFNSGGVWQNLSGAGAIADNLWSTVNVPAGTYHFNYTVTGFCSSDETEVTIVLNPILEVPSAESEITVCAGADINLTVAEIPGNFYQWSGPNNFSSTETNPVITAANSAMSGIYYVTTTSGECTSLPAVVNVNVIPPPEFTLLSSCDNNQFTIGIIPTASSFISDAATYVWSGPDGYTSSGNVVNITGEVPGTYSVTVITESGCSARSEIEIPATLCSVPLGISPNNDSLNDNFDLTGFAVTNLKIFNRYGITVFEQGIYKAEWHGQDYKGRELPAGAYYYLIDLAGGEVKSGWVYVNRQF